MEENLYIHKMEIPPQFGWALLGIVGGIARVFGTWLNQDPKPNNGIFFMSVIFNVFISGFTGYLGATLGDLVTQNEQWHIIFAGVFGYMGVNGLEYLSNLVKEKFNPTIQ